ncbi:DUF4199 domain-containing protein [Sabulilitoribacter multivorans]|uniref:DUF4199 domain-containing protein n=1 Tax=Flaviramulus multivorans TaxID=1304750 RepID=A0ABS9IGE7_9FLAO|nr:DUF4199 domain-containing protein [Flaviramulus multivorans]MCF7559828.1 DUF4199 domain-containing protein [Flaviramulus multivorans]
MKKISLPIRFGLVTSAVLIAYFLVLALFHKHTNPAFSFFNAFITAFGIFEAVRLKKLENTNDFSYGEGFKTGVITGFVATIVFTIFFLFYATEINIDFLPELLHTFKGSFDVDIGMVTFVVAIMGFSTTVVSALTVMQLFKKSGNMSQNS